MWNECNYAVVWTFFDIVFLWDWNENWPFPVLWPLLSFPNLLIYWVQHFHTTSEIRGSSQECQTGTAQEQQRGTTPGPRSGPAARRSYLLPEGRGGGWEELPHAQVRGSSLEKQPHVQGVVAAQAQDGWEKLLHYQGQEGWRWGDTPRPR